MSVDMDPFDTRRVSNIAVTEANPRQSLYAQLAAPFEHHLHDRRGGYEFDYITGEQVVTRLNHVLGVSGWSFDVVEHGVSVEADEIWVLGTLKLYVNVDVEPVVRSQFGSQKIKRGKAGTSPLDIGFDLKGATTDALKKCATLVGVGLYLSSKEPPPADGPSSQMMALIGMGYVAPEASRWPPFWASVAKLRLNPESVRPLLGNREPDVYLRDLDTTIEALYRMLQHHARTGRPLPLSLPTGGNEE